MKRMQNEDQFSIKQVIIVKSNERQGFYINGKLILEKSAIDIEDLIRIYNEYEFHLGMLKICWVTEVYESKLNANGSFPNSLVDVKLEEKSC